MKTHDRLCINYKGSCCPWMGDCECQCMCDYIKEIRDDEDKQILEDLYKMQGKNRIALLRFFKKKDAYRSEGFAEATKFITDLVVRIRIEIRNAKGHY